MSICVILNAHENSPVLHDTIDSINHYLTKDILLIVDGLSWNQFEKFNFPVFKLCGFPHGKPSAPYRNVALGLSKAWNIWGDSKKWYCYLEYDCLVASKEIENHLNLAYDNNFWLLGNDLRTEEKRIPYIEMFLKCSPSLKYFLGCCLFFNSNFMKVLNDNFFEKFLNFTNFYQQEIKFVDYKGKNHILYDLSEFLYPTLACYYGGQIKELCCWKEPNWTGNYEYYPMRFRPDLTIQDPYLNACVLHPLKDFENPIRKYHRSKRLDN